MVTQFKPYLFHITRNERMTLSVATQHLDFTNYDDRDTIDTYRNHAHSTLPDFMSPGLVREKFDISNRNSSSQVTLIEPEMRWLKRGLIEMAEIALDDTENGDWALDHAEEYLTLVDAFADALDETWASDQIERYDQLAVESDYNPID